MPHSASRTGTRPRSKATTTARGRRWSYSSGERGSNRVRAFDRGAKGIYLEWFEVDPPPATTRRRVRMALGHVDRETAKQKADEVALRFRRAEPVKSAELTLGALFEMYEREVSREKGASKRSHDARCREMFTRFFGAGRKPSSLARRDWDRFIAERRSGRIAPKHVEARRKVGDRVVAYDLRYLLAVLNWATVAGDGKGGALLERNPLKGLPMPKEESPRRPIVTAEQYVALRKAAPQVSPMFELFLVLAHETGHRAASIRHLRWADLDLERRTVTFRAEADKIGFEHTVPLTDPAVAMLERARATQRAIGEAWVFPAPRRPDRPCPRDTVTKWWRRAEELAELPKADRRGWHALRRLFASELKHAPLRDLAHLGGWKNPQTVLTVYQRPDEDTQREILASRRRLRAEAVSGAT